MTEQAPRPELPDSPNPGQQPEYPDFPNLGQYPPPSYGANRYTLFDADPAETEVPQAAPTSYDLYQQRHQAYMEEQKAKAAAAVVEYNTAMAEVDAQPWDELCRPAFTPEDLRAAVPDMSLANQTWAQAELLRRDMEASMAQAANREGREQPHVTARIVPAVTPELRELLTKSPVRYPIKAGDLSPYDPQVIQVSREFHNGERAPEQPSEHTPADMSGQRVIAHATLSGAKSLPGARGFAPAEYDIVFTTPVEQTPSPDTYF